MNLLSDIRSGKMATTDDIYKAYGDNKLNNADFKFLTNEFTEHKTPDGERMDKDRELFFKRFAVPVRSWAAVRPRNTAGNLYVAGNGMRGSAKHRCESDRRRPALRVLLTLTSPNFFGKPENLQKYKQPLHRACCSSHQQQLRAASRASRSRSRPSPGRANWPTPLPSCELR